MKPLSSSPPRRGRVPASFSRRQELHLPILTRQYVQRISAEAAARRDQLAIRVQAGASGRLGPGIPVNDVLTELSQAIMEELLTRMSVELLSGFDIVAEETPAPAPVSSLSVDAPLTLSQPAPEREAVFAQRLLASLRQLDTMSPGKARPDVRMAQSYRMNLNPRGR
ncbi:hypothetical protein GMRT_12069 [Giardia muris]|uniref:Uncharacterized protein n=1 Tax=Giardia muris TaxID=5742 RepID=A0A4Z1T599_GIAMU|nr:hypothetical protein GMRT_12069 [Giardia muris]|eukprot:TNJ27689.1 hypothetical protein GMRT_12069 [Giardia muris]